MIPKIFSKTIKVIYYMTMFSSASYAKEALTKIDVAEAFKKPLIIGASVSADYHADSPGKELAFRYTKPSEIKTIAKNGRAGKDTLQLVNLNTLKDRTIVVGVDLFFWDSTKPNPKESIKALNKLMSQVREKNIPIVLGDIPTLMPQYQPSALALNAELLRLCADYDKCYILPLNQILHTTLKDGYLTHRGQRYTLAELIPDGLHVVKPASQYLADQILRLFDV
jgi:hypothetical protein